MPLSELLQMMHVQSHLPHESLPSNPSLSIHPTSNITSHAKHFMRNSPVHFIADQNSQTVYSIPESFLPVTSYQRQPLQTELDANPQINNFVLPNQWANDASRSTPSNWSMNDLSTSEQQYSNCSQRWPMNNFDDKIENNATGASRSDNSVQWYPNDGMNEHTQDQWSETQSTLQKHSNSGAWVTFNQL